MGPKFFNGMLQDRKTALYWAVEKNHVGVVKSILSANPDLELATKVILQLNLRTF